MLLDTPQIRMTDDYSCGTTASRILYGYYGLEFPESFDALASPATGTSIETAVSIIASAFGGHASGYRWTIKDLEAHLALDRPIMCLVGVEEPADHFLIVRGIMGGRVYLQDPSRGRRSLGVARWLESWYGPPGNPYAGFGLVGWLT